MSIVQVSRYDPHQGQPRLLHHLYVPRFLARDSRADEARTGQACGSARSVQAIKSGFQAVSSLFYKSGSRVGTDEDCSKLESEGRCARLERCDEGRSRLAIARSFRSESGVRRVESRFRWDLLLAWGTTARRRRAESGLARGPRSSLSRSIIWR